MTELKDQPDFTVSLSLSPCAQATAMGFDARVLNRFTIRIAEYFLFKNARILFGHDWREDGIMRAVATYAETAASSGRLQDLNKTGERMFNLIPGDDISPLAEKAARAAGGALRVETIIQHLRDNQLSESLPENWSKTNDTRLWALRQELTRLLNPGLRICLGGNHLPRTEKHPAGYTGYYAGIAEEAYFALQHQKPLYLIGGFGGATADVARAILADEDESLGLPSLLPAANDPQKTENLQATADAVDISLDGLETGLKAWTLDAFSENNGLSPDENRALFEMTDLERALELIWKGWSSLKRHRP